MRTLNVALLEWPNGPEAGGPRLLGRTSDPDLIAQVREHLAAKRRRELARLEPFADRGRKGDPEAGGSE